MARAQETRQVMVRMPTELHERIKDVAERQDLTMAQAVRAAVRRYLSEAEIQPAV